MLRKHTFLTALVAGAALTAPASPSVSGTAPAAPGAAAKDVKARNDKVTLQVGGHRVVNVLRNDRVTTTARIRVSSTDPADPVVARKQGTRVKITASATAAGTHLIAYRVIDSHGHRDKAKVTVTIKSPTTPASALLTDMIAAMPTAVEVDTGYDRDLFRHWIDADGNGCDTRQEVLIVEAATPTTVGADCELAGGSWYSYYDATTTSDSSSFDIDHAVALAEAWGSGAHAWDSATREAFANDLDDPQALVAVSASSNRSKSDRDPAEWMPLKERCRYLAAWVGVTYRWDLSVDATEKASMAYSAQACPDTLVTVVPAVVTAYRSAQSPTLLCRLQSSRHPERH